MRITDYALFIKVFDPEGIKYKIKTIKTKFIFQKEKKK